LSSIGIFDSGVGGLTVMRELLEALPQESFLYLGDTARLPYGSKSPQTIRRYLTQNIDFLKRFGTKAIVVACNSASTVLDTDEWNGLPIYGVIRPGAGAACSQTRNKRIGVLGTRATIRSSAYRLALHAADPSVTVFQQACPLLVPLVEEGLENDVVTDLLLERYLSEILAADIDTLILGCTHYPVLKQRIARIVGPAVTLVDSARVIADKLTADLHEGRLPASRGSRTNLIWMTDTAEDFQVVGRRILEPYQVDEWRQADLQ